MIKMLCFPKISDVRIPPGRSTIALFTIIRTDRNMLLACYSHKHISYRIRTIIRKAIITRIMDQDKKIVNNLSIYNRKLACA
ncbi:MULTISPECIES: hypothetical protein [Wolbachia]|uniref:hypothetical protein n=1 Tax=Wolbachia TaxID=953 RepID=UPI001C7177EE|nr:hypothetical protein [Wolbachia pipientis]